MPVKKHSVEQIIAKLREIEKLTAQGLSILLAAKKVGVTDQTFAGASATARSRKKRPSGCSCWSRRTPASSASSLTRLWTSPCSFPDAVRVRGKTSFSEGKLRRRDRRAN
ncbi:MAG: hypothetical protein M3P38_05040 [Chloroflexota bacterium]|nr:hypothetical protein [Chloroflexota bacterium]